MLQRQCLLILTGLVSVSGHIFEAGEVGKPSESFYHKFQQKYFFMCITTVSYRTCSLVHVTSCRYLAPHQTYTSHDVGLHELIL
jgi:hypothetical protein